MDIQKFKKIIGPTVQKLRESEQRYRTNSGFTPLAQILREFYERITNEKLVEEEVKRYD